MISSGVTQMLSTELVKKYQTILSDGEIVRKCDELLSEHRANGVKLDHQCALIDTVHWAIAVYSGAIKHQQKIHGCHECGEEVEPIAVNGGLVCPECGSTDLVCLEDTTAGKPRQQVDRQNQILLR